MTPADGRPKRPLPFGKVASTPRRQFEAPVERRDQLVGRQVRRAGGNELDRER